MMLNRHYLAGPGDPAADAAGSALGNVVVEMLQGSSDPDSPEAKARAKFYGNVLGIAGRQVLASDEGQAALNKSLMTVVLPLSLLAFAAGYWYSKQRKG